MKKTCYGLISLWMLLCVVTSARAEVSIGIGLPDVSIGINLPLFPELVPVPGYPVYYAPRVDGNYFFYDGMYWVYQDDYWYASSWYNGPWAIVDPGVVPLFILRIPVRYYRQPPVYFRSWQSNAPPRWGQHWGRGWEQRRSGWDRWNRRSVPSPAPLPVYQRQYSGDRYPRVEQQHTIRSQQYRYQPRNNAVRQHFQQQIERGAPVPAQRGRHEEPPMRAPRQQDIQRQTPLQQSAPAAPGSEPRRRGGENLQRTEPTPTAPQQRGPAIQDQRRQPAGAEREQHVPRTQGQERRSPDRRDSQEPDRGRGQGHDKDEDRGRGRNN